MLCRLQKIREEKINEHEFKMIAFYMSVCILLLLNSKVGMLFTKPLVAVTSTGFLHFG